MPTAMPERISRHLDLMIAMPLEVAASIEQARTLPDQPRYAAEAWSERRECVVSSCRRIREAIASIPDPAKARVARDYVLERLPESFVTEAEVAYLSGAYPDVRATEFFGPQNEQAQASEAAPG